MEVLKIKFGLTLLRCNWIKSNSKKKTIGASYGDAFISACTVGEIKKDDINKWNEVEYQIEANLDNQDVYNKGYEVFRELYDNTKHLMKKLNT